MAQATSSYLPPFPPCGRGERIVIPSCAPPKPRTCPKWKCPTLADRIPALFFLLFRVSPWLQKAPGSACTFQQPGDEKFLAQCFIQLPHWFDGCIFRRI